MTESTPGDSLQRSAGWFIVAGSLAVVWLIGLYRYRGWLAEGDVAVLQLRLEQISDGDVPLVGAYSRLRFFHPGPLREWMTWVPYQLSGRRSAAVPATNVVWHLGWIAVALHLAKRVGGRRAMVVTAAVAVLVLIGAGAALSNPWNPYVAITPGLAAGWGVVAVLRNRGRGFGFAIIALAAMGQLHLSATLPSVVATVVLVMAVVVHRERRVAVGCVAWAMLCWGGPLLDLLIHGSDANIFRILSGAGGDRIGIARGIRSLGYLANPLYAASGRAWQPGHPDPSSTIRGGFTVAAVLVFAALGAVWLARRRHDAGAATTATTVALGSIVVALNLSLLTEPAYSYLFSPLLGFQLALVATLVWVYVEILVPHWSIAPRWSLERVPTALAGLALGSTIAIAALPGWLGDNEVQLQAFERSIPGAIASAASPGEVYNIEAIAMDRTVAEADVAVALKRQGSEVRSDIFKLDVPASDPSAPTFVVVMGQPLECVRNTVGHPEFVVYGIRKNVALPVGVILLTPAERLLLTPCLGSPATP